jgi:hypothetical protein
VDRAFGFCLLCRPPPPHNGYVPGMTKSSW